MFRPRDQLSGSLYELLCIFRRRGKAHEYFQRTPEIREAEEARTHPFYWANFILIGDNAPAEPPARRPWWLFALMGVGVAGGIGYGWKRRQAA